MEASRPDYMGGSVATSRHGCGGRRLGWLLGRPLPVPDSASLHGWPGIKVACLSKAGRLWWGRRSGAGHRREDRLGLYIAALPICLAAVAAQMGLRVLRMAFSEDMDLCCRCCPASPPDSQIKSCFVLHRSINLVMYIWHEQGCFLEQSMSCDHCMCYSHTTLSWVLLL